MTRSRAPTLVHCVDCMVQPNRCQLGRAQHVGKQARPVMQLERQRLEQSAPQPSLTCTLKAAHSQPGGVPLLALGDFYLSEAQ